MTRESLDVVFPAPGDVELVRHAVPEPGPTEITCRALASLVSTGTETFCLAGDFEPGTFWQEWVRFPFAPGYSLTAEVVAVGRDIDDVRVGDRVALPAPHAQYVTVPRDEAIVVPDGVRSEDACWASLAVTTQWGVRRTGLDLGESVGVIGLGLLGQLIVRYLRLSGARHIVAIDPDPARREAALRGGATVAVADHAGAAHDAVRAETGGELLDVAFDVTGHPVAFADTSTLLRPHGRLVLVGDSPHPSQQHLGPRIVADGITIIGVHASTAPERSSIHQRWTPAEMTALFFDHLRDGRLEVESLITHRASPLDAPELYAALREDRSRYLGVLFDWSAVPA